jgi:flagellar protein FlgJ
MSEIGKINSRPIPTAADKLKAADEKLHEVSDMYEQHFIREMMKQMRATVHEGGFIQQSNAEKLFRDQLDDQYAEQWTKSGGIGLSKMIYEQLMDKYGTKMGLKKPVDKPLGPLPVNEKSTYTGVTSSGKPASGSNSLGALAATGLDSAASEDGLKSGQPVTCQFQSPANEKTELSNPWAGVLLDKKYLEMDQMQYRIKHDNGLESLILTRGTGLGMEQKLSPGDAIAAGQQLGWVSSASPVFWTVKPNVSE